MPDNHSGATSRSGIKQKYHLVASSMALTISTRWAGPGQGQNTTRFQIVEATIDDIHMAFRSGRVTARQFAQGYLDRINAYDKEGPTIIPLSPSMRTRLRRPTGSTQRFFGLEITIGARSILDNE
jgi:hypothetical protein